MAAGPTRSAAAKPQLQGQALFRPARRGSAQSDAASLLAYPYCFHWLICWHVASVSRQPIRRSSASANSFPSSPRGNKCPYVSSVIADVGMAEPLLDNLRRSSSPPSTFRSDSAARAANGRPPRRHHQDPDRVPDMRSTMARRDARGRYQSGCPLVRLSFVWQFCHNYESGGERGNLSNYSELGSSGIRVLPRSGGCGGFLP